MSPGGMIGRMADQAVPTAPTAAHFSAAPSSPPLQQAQFGGQAYKEQRMGQLFQRSLRMTPIGSLANSPPAV